MIKRANVQWSVKTLVKMSKSNKISFDNAIQRGYCWDKERKSLLIHSVIEGYPIPAFYAAKNAQDAGSVYDMLDGKQRSNALCEFLDDKYVLSDLPCIQFENSQGEQDELDISGLKYSQLPEELQDTISDYSLTVYYFDGITEEEIAELFWRLNNGKPLSAIELTRVKTKSKEAIQHLGKHQIFDVALTDSAINKFTHEEIIFKSVAVLFHTDPSLDTKFIRSVTEKEITSVQVGMLDKVYDLFLDVLKQIKEAGNKKLLKTITTKTHFITCVYTIHRALIKETASLPVLVQWATEFFSAPPEQYLEASRVGSAKADNVDTRHILATCAYDQLADKE